MIKLLSVLFSITLLCPSLATAELSLIGKNRIIFENKDANNRLRLDISNQNTRTSLANISIEWPDHRQEEIPFAVSSPLVSIPAEKQKSIELFYQGQGLPKDRESYFLLSILDVPIAPKEGSSIQIALRHRYKLIFRPKLNMTPDQAVKLLNWQRLSLRGEIEANNPSPYYLTITNLTRKDQQSHNCGNSISHTMLEPFSKKILTSEGCSESVQALRYNVVIDNGQELEQYTKVKSEIRQ